MRLACAFSLHLHPLSILPPRLPFCAQLYLLVTAGSVYIKSMQGRAADVLADLLELVKGVQQPQRGLFLRHYLAQKCKDKLPDSGSPYDGESPVAVASCAGHSTCHVFLHVQPPAALHRPPLPRLQLPLTAATYPPSSRPLPRAPAQVPAARCPTPSTSSSRTSAR